MSQTVIVDFRNIAKICSYSTLSGTIACSFPTESEEIAYRIAKRLYCIRLDYPEAEIILANDRGPYWRSDYINTWYSKRGEEPVPYKGNRVGMPWPFSTSSEAMNLVYDQVQKDMCNALDMIIAEDTGLEADDVWGLVSRNVPVDREVIGISSDSDWRQLCGPNVKVVDPATGAIYTEKEDITAKCVAGDRGDNIMGCPKSKKDGTSSGKMWGRDGAEKLIEKDPNWLAIIDQDIYKRNQHLITLPCPGWDIIEAFLALKACYIYPKECDFEAIMKLYGLTAQTRKLLEKQADRDAWIKKMRAHLQETNEKVKTKVALAEKIEEAVGVFDKLLVEPAGPSAESESGGVLFKGKANFITESEGGKQVMYAVQVLPEWEFYGFSDDWKDDVIPDRVTACMEAKHKKRHISDGKGNTDVSCDICNFGYKLKGNNDA